MSAFHTLELACPCGNKFKHTVARGINVKRKPELREQILKGDFHRVSCPECKVVNTVEATFTYADPKRNLFIQVRPQKQFFHWKRASEFLERKVSKLPANTKAGNSDLRVVFGLAALREKLLCQNARIDDRMLEMVKVNLLYEHPFLMRRPRLEFVLVAADKNTFEFRASHIHEKRHYQIVVPAVKIEQFKKLQTRIQTKIKASTAGNNIFDKKHGHFASYLRYMPETGALALLHEYAELVRNKKEVGLQTAKFRQMLKKLPRASHLPTSAKNDLRKLSDYARQKNDDETQGALWEVRFGKELDPDYWNNESDEDIDTLWDVFEQLPDDHIDGNNSIREVTLSDIGWNGTYYGGTQQIEIAEDIIKDREDFLDTIRHEVGHSVHDKHYDKVNGWLQQRFGWQTFDITFKGMDAWITAMDGWGNADKKQKEAVFRCFQKAFERRSEDQEEFNPVKVKGNNHLWNAAGFKPKQAYDLSVGNWFMNYKKHVKNKAKNKAFFLHYGYEYFYMVDVSTLNLISQMPSPYASSSESEFFAELYALYHNQESKFWKNIPPKDKKWLKDLE